VSARGRAVAPRAGRAVKVAGKSGISQARTRVGWAPLQQLYDDVVRPDCPPGHAGGWYRSLAAGEPGRQHLGRGGRSGERRRLRAPRASRGASAFPQLRFARWSRTARTSSSGAPGPYATGETTLAADALQALCPGMLCLADRLFFGYALWTQRGHGGRPVLAGQAQSPVAVRGAAARRLLPEPDLPQCRGSSARPPRGGGAGRRVPVGRRAGGGAPVPAVTTLLDPGGPRRRSWPRSTRAVGDRDRLRRAEDAPAGGRIVLRSKTPDLVRRSSTACCWRISPSAASCTSRPVGGGGPDRLSFLHAVRVVRRKLPASPRFPPRDRPAFHAAVLRELVEERVVSSRGRRTPRGVKRKMTKYPLRPRKHVQAAWVSLVPRVKIVK